MYKKFFGLKQEPFSIAPDPHYLFMSERHREALAHLLYGVRGGGGFVLLTGEIGAGKTTVCRCFLEQVPRRTNVAYIFNPRQTAEELLESICEDFRIPRDIEPGRVPSARDHVAALNEFLLRTHGAGQNNVLIIDEAQSLSAEVLEQLRLLTNLETNERKLLQIILIGQPELRDMLARPELEQLAQRVIARYHLDALTPRETAQYIHHRLTVSGPEGCAALRRGLGAAHPCVVARRAAAHQPAVRPRAARCLCQRQAAGRRGHRRQGRGRGRAARCRRAHGGPMCAPCALRVAAALGLGVVGGCGAVRGRPAGLRRAARARRPTQQQAGR